LVHIRDVKDISFQVYYCLFYINNLGVILLSTGEVKVLNIYYL